MNHSCEPNAALAFSGARLHVRALADLGPGTVLRISYGPQAGESIRAVRRAQLAAAYTFACRCRACCSDASDLRDAQLVGLRCGHCGGPVLPALGCGAGVCSLHELPAGLPAAGACFGCGRGMSVQEQTQRLARLRGAAAAFQQAMDAAAPARLLQQCLKACLEFAFAS